MTAHNHHVIDVLPLLLRILQENLPCQAVYKQTTRERSSYGTRLFTILSAQFAFAYNYESIYLVSQKYIR